MDFHIGRVFLAFQFILMIVLQGVNLSKGANVTIVNNCKETIWPGISPNNNFSGDGFALKAGQSTIFTAPPGWHGRIWGRTGCNFDRDGNGTCQTGSCGNTIKCSQPGQPPASIAQFTFGEVDYYDVSLVDGFNLPIAVRPINGKGNCSSVGCDSDLRSNCPSELVLTSDGKNIGCRSACNVFDSDEYCCRGLYSSPMSCLPTNYSRTFKTACPAAYSYAYDDPTSVVTCTAADYVISFCSSRNQTQCTFHDRTLNCNGSGKLHTFPNLGQILMVTLIPAISNLRHLF